MHHNASYYSLHLVDSYHMSNASQCIPLINEVLRIYSLYWLCITCSNLDFKIMLYDLQHLKHHYTPTAFHMCRNLFQVNSFTLFGMWIWICMFFISHVFVRLKPVISYHIWMLVLLLLIEILLKVCFSWLFGYWGTFDLFMSLYNIF